LRPFSQYEVSGDKATFIDGAHVITFTAGWLLTLSTGFYLTPVLFGYIFEDNASFNMGPRGIGGVEVQLFDSTGTDLSLSIHTCNNYGSYSFHVNRNTVYVIKIPRKTQPNDRILDSFGNNTTWCGHNTFFIDHVNVISSIYIGNVESYKLDIGFSTRINTESGDWDLIKKIKIHNTEVWACVRKSDNSIWYTRRSIAKVIAAEMKYDEGVAFKKLGDQHLVRQLPDPPLDNTTNGVFLKLLEEYYIKPGLKFDIIPHSLVDKLISNVKKLITNPKNSIPNSTNPPTSGPAMVTNTTPTIPMPAPASPPTSTTSATAPTPAPTTTASSTTTTTTTTMTTTTIPAQTPQSSHDLQHIPQELATQTRSPLSPTLQREFPGLRESFSSSSTSSTATTPTTHSPSPLIQGQEDDFDMTTGNNSDSNSSGLEPSKKKNEIKRENTTK